MLFPKQVALPAEMPFHVQIHCEPHSLSILGDPTIHMKHLPMSCAWLHIVFIECWQLCSFTEVISEPAVICNSWRAGLVLICSLHPLRNALHVRQEYMLV